MSQKHHPVESQDFEMSQKSLMASMSQSIRVSTKKNQGIRIPSSRYLTLRVDFTKIMERNELPPSLKQKDQFSASHCLLSPALTSRGCTAGANSGVKDDGANDKFVVTPLGRIAENGYSGLCVDMTARTRESRQDDEKNIHFSQPSSSSDFMLFSQAEMEEWEEIGEERYDHEEEESCLPFTQAPEEDSARNDTNIKTLDCIQKSAAYFCDDDNEEKRDHTPCTQPPRKEQATQNESHAVAVESLFTNRDDSQTQPYPDEIGDNEKVEIKVGGKAFGLPYGLKCGQKYILCDVRDHRVTRSCLDGMEREEYKCAFKDCKELEAVGKKKQWIMRSKLLAYSCMKRNVRSSLFARDYYLKERNEQRDTRIFDAVEEELNVDRNFVKKIAKKRKSAPSEKKNKSKRLKRSTVW
mmetsp:Transcript_36870/g.77342  ORF Transcript_36870/g.77342 Transcript_36870/m.77342 type:complete len:410 (-) Transcript_36870:1488-2717(-)